MPHSSVAALHAPTRTTGKEVRRAPKLYLQEPEKHWGALQAAERISICQTESLKRSTPTRDSRARYRNGIASASLGQARLNRGTAGLAARATHTPRHPNREAQLGKEVSASSPASLCHFPDSPSYCSSRKVLHRRAVGVTPAARTEHHLRGLPAGSGAGPHHPGEPQASGKPRDNRTSRVVRLPPRPLQQMPKPHRTRNSCAQAKGNQKGKRKGLSNPRIFWDQFQKYARSE